MFIVINHRVYELMGSIIMVYTIYFVSPENDRNVTEHAKWYMLQDASFMH